MTEGCAFEPYCKRLLKIKTGKSRIFEIQPHHAQLKQQARDLLLSPEGIELRVNRSCQVEGAFGVLKQNMQYTRFRRRALDPSNGRVRTHVFGDEYQEIYPVFN